METTWQTIKYFFLLTESDSVDSACTSGAGRGSRARSASLGANRVQSNQSQQPIRMKSARRRAHSSYYDHTTQPAFIKSLFPSVPPYLNFIGIDDKGKPVLHTSVYIFNDTRKVKLCHMMIFMQLCFL